MRTLYLHIGHSKTGSSYLQASFANSLKAMAAQGIDYPGVPSAAASGWQISSGNGQRLPIDPPEAFTVTGQKVFFSAEPLFRAFAMERRWTRHLAAFCAHHDIGQVEVLMFLRDPILHAESTYQQMVKRGGITEDVDPTFEQYVQPQLVCDALDRDFGPVPLRWHVFNYDRNKTALLEIAERFLGLPAGVLERGGDPVVNRSMTAGELMVLRGLNAQDPKAAQALADAWCNEVPDVDSEPAFPSRPIQKAMLRRQAEAIKEIHTRLDPAQQYDTTLQRPARHPERYFFSPRQIEVMGQVLGARTGHVTQQMHLERARRLLQAAQVSFRQGRPGDAELNLTRAKAVLDPLDDGFDPSIPGLRQGAATLTAKLTAKLAEQAAAAAPDAPPAKSEP
ncbi:MAG: hypothetical protein AAGF79_00075 [Pseudomonadota bacterium]